MNVETEARAPVDAQMTTVSMEPHSNECGDDRRLYKAAGRVPQVSMEPHSNECGDVGVGADEALPLHVSMEPHSNECGDGP